jgi:hypothetical protein
MEFRWFGPPGGGGWASLRHTLGFRISLYGFLSSVVETKSPTAKRRLLGKAAYYGEEFINIVFDWLDWVKYRNRLPYISVSGDFGFDTTADPCAAAFPASFFCCIGLHIYPFLIA